MRHMVLVGALLVSLAANAAIPSSQRDALVALYQSTGGDQWTDRTGWLGTPGSECDWHGVQCDEQRQNVDVLFLSENNLTGTLPAELSKLTKLRSLQLYANAIGGSIPSSIGQLSELESLYLGHNQLTGDVPASIGALAKLVELFVDDNHLTQIPPTVTDLAALRYLSFSHNELTGELPDLTRLVKLEMVSAGVNQLSGALPALPSSIEFADFASNRFSGTIPRSYGSLASLTYLRVSYNRLQGGIPPELGQLSKVETLDLHGNALGGEIPKALAGLSSIRWLTLDACGLTGTIPSEIYGLATLEELHLGENQLEGEISEEIGRLRNLKKVSLNANRLEGPIPEALTTLDKLQSIELLANSLTGPVPPALSRLSDLRYLDLGSNGLTGTIPPQLGDLTKLTFLALYQNELDGPIPPELGKLTQLTVLYLGGNRLTGPVPDSLRSLRKLVALGANGNLLTGSIPAWIGELTALEELDFSFNGMSGALPAGLSGLEKLEGLGLTHNEFTGPLPDFARLTRLKFFYASDNLFSGRIPETIGQATKLLDLTLGRNFLTGPLPREIGNLTSLGYFDASGNSLDGPIPAEIGLLRSAYSISLNGNRFSGPIPRQIGDLAANLRYLGLSFNALKGPIPTEITKLTRLEPEQSDFSYNALYTADAAVRAFVNRAGYGGDFEVTQTVAPSDVRVTGTTDRNAALAWTPIRYVYDPGGYQVVVSTASGGTPVAVATTPSKEATSITVRNLDPSTRYFFTVTTVTHPHPDQKNVLVSDGAPELQATTGERVVAPAEVVITELPEGMVQIDGVEAVGDRFSLTNFGDVATTVELERGGEFFSIDASSFALAAGASRTVTLRSIAQPPGTYYGHVLVRGQGVAEDTIAYVVLLSVKRPAGSVVAQPVNTTIEVAGAPGSDGAGVAQFRNTGTAELTGIVVSDQPWVVPDAQPITISPGAIGSVTFRVVRSKRPAGAAGALTATLSLVYVDGGSASGIEIADGAAGVTVSKVTIVDTTKPPVAVGPIPPLGTGELALFVPGIASSATVRTDLSLVNAFGGSAISDLKLYFSAGGATSIASLQPLESSAAINLVNVAGTIYGAADSGGTLQIRSRSWANIATDAKVTAVAATGTYAGAIPVFRSDRSAPSRGEIYLPGVEAGSDLFLQETSGASTTVSIAFLDAAGSAVAAVRTETLAGYAERELSAAVPPDTATVVVTNGGAGAVAAYARVRDASSGDSWSVVDWARFHRFAGDEPMRIPFVDGQPDGGRGKRRAVRTTAVPPTTAQRAATDVVLFNPSAAEVPATLQIVAADGSTIDRTIRVAARATLTLRDVGAVTRSPTAHAVITPVRGTLAVSARSHAGASGTAIPVLGATQGIRLGQSQLFAALDDSSAYRTGYGLVETGGQPVTVRARVLIGEGSSLVTATTARTFTLSPRQQVYLPELLRSFAGTARDALGDFHDLTLEFEVTGGEGSVVPLVLVTDTASGDSTMKVR